MHVGTVTLISVLLVAGKPRSFVDSAALSLHPNSVDDLQKGGINGRMAGLHFPLSTLPLSNPNHLIIQHTISAE
ncbi:hypothetical protein J6590_059670 [Homalodisca vitripennis]|nr:hypothetical protein J6590_059670 [Homalodisca vitripennis]